MDATTRDQIFNLIDKSQSILLLTHAKADCDGLGSMISMYLALQALGKEVTAATNDPAPEVLSFLPSIHIVQNSVTSNDFVITLDIRNTPLNKIKYKLAEDHSRVNIIVTPRSGQFKAEDVTFGKDEKHFDLIITFDTGNLEHLGPIYDQNAELFFNTPLINIDHHASNTDYGQVNFVDVVSASTTEMMLDLLREMETRYEKKFLTPDVSTLLLAGLITDTGSFQHANTSPRAMEVAAQLLDLGARQQEIIKNIYKTKKLTTLKLWGTVLSKVETDPIYRLVWSSISKSDLNETGANSEESEGIIDDLLSNAPGAELIMLFKYNEEGYVSVSMRSTTNSVDVGKICAEMGGGGHVRAAGLKRRDSTSLEKLIEDTLIKVRDYQGNRLNIHPDRVRPMFPAPLPVPKTPPQNPITPDLAPSNPPNEGQTVQYLEFKGQNQPVKEKEVTLQPAPVQSPPKAQETAPKQAPPQENQPRPPREAQAKGERPHNHPPKVSPVAQPTQQKSPSPQAPQVKRNEGPRNEGRSIETLKKDFVSKPTPVPAEGDQPKPKEIPVQQPLQPTPEKPLEKPLERPKSSEPQAEKQPEASPEALKPMPLNPEAQENRPQEEIPPAPSE